MICMFLNCNLVISISYGCCSRVNKRTINRFVNVACQSFLRKSSYKKKKTIRFFILHRYLESLAIEIYKVRCGLSYFSKEELFRSSNENSYNLRHLCQFEAPSVSVSLHRKCFVFRRFVKVYSVVLKNGE